MAAGNKSAQAVTRIEHEESLDAKRVIMTDPFGGVITDGNYTTLMDNDNPDVIYIGKAQCGSDTPQGRADDIWQIKKIDKTTSPQKLAVWAGGTDSFSNIWENRKDLSYT